MANFGGLLTAVFEGLLVFLTVFAVILNIPAKKYLINVRSGKYHTLQCPAALKVSMRFRKFVYQTDEIKAGTHSSCKICTPDSSRR